LVVARDRLGFAGSAERESIDFPAGRPDPNGLQLAPESVVWKRPETAPARTVPGCAVSTRRLLTRFSGRPLDARVQVLPESAERATPIVVPA
jgi:hypothetical protein